MGLMGLMGLHRCWKYSVHGVKSKVFQQGLESSTCLGS